MNLKEDIISRGIGYEGNNFQTNYFLSNLAKGFIKDKEIFGEDVVSLYSDIFGQESGPLFEAFYEDADVLEESITLGKELLFESGFGLGGDRVAGMLSQARSNTAHGLGGDRADDSMKLSQKSGSLSDVVTAASANAPAKTGFLSTLWDSIKKFGSSLAAKFPGVSGFLKNGVSWITAHPAIVLASAGGAALIGGLIKAFKNKGKNKQADKLQATLDDAKAKGKVNTKGAASVDTEKKGTEVPKWLKGTKFQYAGYSTERGGKQSGEKGSKKPIVQK